MLPGVVPPTPVLLTCRGIRLVHAFPDVAYAKIIFTANVISICGASTIGFSGGGKAENFPMVPQLNNVLYKIALLV